MRAEGGELREHVANEGNLSLFLEVIVHALACFMFAMEQIDYEELLGISEDMSV